MYKETYAPRSSKTRLRCCLAQDFLFLFIQSLHKRSSATSLNAGAGHVSCWTGSTKPTNSCPGNLRTLHPSSSIPYSSQQEMGSNPVITAGRARCWIWAWVTLHSWTWVENGKSSPLVTAFHLRWEEDKFKQCSSRSYICWVSYSSFLATRTYELLGDNIDSTLTCSVSLPVYGSFPKRVLICNSHYFLMHFIDNYVPNSGN